MCPEGVQLLCTEMLMGLQGLELLRTEMIMVLQGVGCIILSIYFAPVVSKPAWANTEFALRISPLCLAPRAAHLQFETSGMCKIRMLEPQAHLRKL